MAPRDRPPGFSVFSAARRVSSMRGSDAPNVDVPRAEVHVSVRLHGPSLSPFAVVYDERRRTLRSRTRAEVGRTETITHAGGGGVRTFLRSFLVRTSRNPNLRVALFDFVKSSTLVEDHVFLGAATFSLADVLASGVSTKQLTIGNAVAYSAGQNEISITLRASRVDSVLFAARRSVALRIVLPEMRRRKFPHQHVTQSFDISRCAPTSDPNAPPSWVPVYRSEALASPSSPNERYVRFDAATIPEWRLYGLNTPLRIRLLQHSVRSVRVSVAGVCNTTLQELQVLDPSRDFLSLFGARQNAQCIGRLFLTQAEPTKSGGVFSLTAEYLKRDSMSSAKRALSMTMNRFTSLRSERKFLSRGTEDWSFGSREASVGSARSIDRFTVKLRRKVASENLSHWAASSTTTSDANVQDGTTNSDTQTTSNVRQKSRLWPSWFHT